MTKVSNNEEANNVSHQLGTNGKVSLTFKQRIVKGTFSDDHMSVFSHDDDDERGNYASKDDPQFEFNPFSASNMPVFEHDNDEVKKD